MVQGPESTYPEVIVKETGGTRGSAFVNRKFEAGLKLMAYPPQGRLLPTSWTETPSHFVLFAAGVGITPLYHVMQHLLGRAKSSMKSPCSTATQVATTFCCATSSRN